MRSIFVSALLVALALVVTSRVAQATPNFPPAIGSHLQLAAAPACALCHSDGDQGGKGTATTPFATNMKTRGLVEFDVGSLNTALDHMATDHVSSIGDCLDDIDELKAGRDPNLPDPAGACEDAGLPADAPPTGATPISESPRYGCVGRIAPDPIRSAPDPLYGIGALFLFTWLRRRRVNFRE